MPFFPPHAFDYGTQVSAGLVPGVDYVMQIGNAVTGVQTTATDIWGRADSIPTQQIWLAPTAARIHAIVSSSASDDGSPVGVGARTIRVYGLTSWTTEEIFEDITLNGTGAVNTVNSYVMINRLKVLTSGATSINVGTITATAATDSTITAVILPLDGVSQQAIYGIPSIKTAYIAQLNADLETAVTQTRVFMDLMVNHAPQLQPTIFTHEYSFHTQNSGTTNIIRRFICPLKISGPAIIKMQGIATGADTSVCSSLDIYLVSNSLIT